MSLEDRVIEFIAEETGTKKSEITLDTLVNDDIGVDGVDGDELICLFSEKFDVDLSEMQDQYFGPEGFSLFLIFEGSWSFISGLLGFKDKIKPLPVSQFVKSAKARTWTNI